MSTQTFHFLERKKKKENNKKKKKSVFFPAKLDFKCSASLYLCNHEH